MKCGQCGLCREKCPVFRAILKETASPRAKGILKKEEAKDKLFYLCTLCGECSCQITSEEEMRAEREKLVKAGIELKRNREMLENLKKHGHPFFEAKEE